MLFHLTPLLVPTAFKRLYVAVKSHDKDYKLQKKADAAHNKYKEAAAQDLPTLQGLQVGALAASKDSAIAAREALLTKINGKLEAAKKAALVAQTRNATCTALAAEATQLLAQVRARATPPPLELWPLPLPLSCPEQAAHPCVPP